MKIALIGAGNVAVHIAKALHENGADITQVYSRNIANAKSLAQKMGSAYIDDIAHLDLSADAYIFAVKDDAIEDLLEQSGRKIDKLLIHTAGCVPMDIFQKYADNYGVIYPLQTFSKNKAIDFRAVPVFVEANNETALNQLLKIANSLSNNIIQTNSAQRKKLHLAAVFACNFTNYLYDIAAETVQKAGLPFDVLQPLIAETADKIKTLTPREAQTGPAVRHDEQTMQQHLRLLENQPELQKIYKQLSEGIASPSPSEGGDVELLRL